MYTVWPQQTRIGFVWCRSVFPKTNFVTQMFRIYLQFLVTVTNVHTEASDPRSSHQLLWHCAAIMIGCGQSVGRNLAVALKQMLKVLDDLKLGISYSRFIWRGRWDFLNYPLICWAVDMLGCLMIGSVLTSAQSVPLIVWGKCTHVRKPATDCTKQEFRNTDQPVGKVPLGLFGDTLPIC